MSGPSAFPSPGGSSSGMDLRDYFAAKAMQALAGDPDILKAISDSGPRGEENKTIATAAYQLADAMLKARQS